MIYKQFVFYKFIRCVAASRANSLKFSSDLDKNKKKYPQIFFTCGFASQSYFEKRNKNS